MINRTVLVGRLTKDPELRYTPSGIATVRFTIAVNRPFTGQNGEKEADFINCVAWRKQAENLANFQRKGNLIGLEGRIQTGSYEGQDGKRVYTTDVIADSIQFLEPRSEGQASQQQQPPQQQQNYQAPPQQQQNYQAPPQQQPPQYQQSYQAPPQQQPQYQQNYQAPSQNYTRVDEDPFANHKGPVEVSEDDLPF